MPFLIGGILIIMLIRSMIRAFQRWEIIPDPLLPEKWRNRWNAVEKGLTDRFTATLSGKKGD